MKPKTVENMAIKIDEDEKSKGTDIDIINRKYSNKKIVHYSMNSLNFITICI